MRVRYQPARVSHLSLADRGVVDRGVQSPLVERVHLVRGRTFDFVAASQPAGGLQVDQFGRVEPEW